MKRLSHILLTSAAYLLAACAPAPAAPSGVAPTVDAFVAPGGPTPVVPTRTPALTPTLPPSATPEPPTATAAPATAAPATAAPTRPAGTPTPTPVTVNGKPRVWWVDQMVRQPDGSFMAPEAVRQAIRAFVIEHNLDRTIPAGQDWKAAARASAGRDAIVADLYYIGDLRKLVAESTSPQLHMIVSGLVSVADIRAFGADGLTAHVLVDFSAITTAIFSTSDWSIIESAHKPSVPIQLWRIRFDTADGRWKYEELLATSPR